MIKLEKFLRRGAGHDAAGLEQNDARREQQRFPQIVGDKNNRFAKSPRESAEFALKFRARDGIERAERFVHQQNRRIGGERASHADALALPAGKFARAPLAKFAWIEADKLKHFLDARGDARRGPFLQSGNERDILRNREMGEESGFLDHVADATTEADGVPIAGGASLDLNLPIGGKQHAIDQFEEGGLAAAAAAEKDDSFSLRNC